MNYFNHIARAGRPGPFDHPPIRGDVVDWPEIAVTEEPLTEDALQRFRAAQDQCLPELLP